MKILKKKEFFSVDHLKLPLWCHMAVNSTILEIIGKIILIHKTILMQFVVFLSIFIMNKKNLHFCISKRQSDAILILKIYLIVL